MRRAFCVATGLWLIGTALAVQAESTWEFSVQVSAAVQKAPAQINLSWPQDTYLLPDSYTVFRKDPNSTSWGNGTTLPGTTTSFLDTNVSVGVPYEYQVVKQTSQYTGYGYIYAGIQLPVVENRGKLLLVVDNTYAGSLSNELTRLQQDIVGDGWTVTRLDVNRNDSVVNVKSRIKAQYSADPVNVRAVFLFGHVPVPYSGDVVPDGHVPDHQGAWPCDGFYGDMDGTWTDNTVNDSVASDPRNRNVPGDGKFDQSTFPAPIKLMVGRVDLANMPGRMTWGGPATFASELELLRNYLNKDHKFRHKQFDLPRRAILGDSFGVRNGEAFAASGWRNFAPFFGATNLTNEPNQGTWVPALGSTPCLCAYGCGAGSFTSISGLGNSDTYHDAVTTEIVSNDLKTVFAFVFGSWFGDWDTEDNVMRSILALPSYGLASAWSGRPHWFLQHMALGETLGFAARLTQNNCQGGLYKTEVNSAAGSIHIALMGDPTLRLHTVAPPSNLIGSTNASGFVLNWTGSTDSIAGYRVYSAADPNGPYTRLTRDPVTGSTFTDTNTVASAAYMVRAVKLETSASGSYSNLSQGILLAPGSSSIDNLPIIAGNNPTNVNNSLSSSSTTTNGTGPVASGPAATNNPVTPVGPTGGPSNSPVVWVDDALPAGAVGGADGGDSWNCVSSNPTPFSGTLASQGNLAPGLHEHYFAWAASTLGVSTGDVLFAYVYLDPANPPSELMLQSYDGSWEHRAYWGANNIFSGTDRTSSRRYMGPLPATGQWVPLQVPASQVALEGSTLSGMSFSLFDGQATWDYAGKAAAALTNSTPATNSVAATNSTGPVVWVDDALPAGAVTTSDGGDSWNWVTNNPLPFSGTTANQSTIAAGFHQHYFTGASSTLSIGAGDLLFACVYMDPANPPSELMLQWLDSHSWEHRAYWGANNINYGIQATASRSFVGPLPAPGQWALLQVPASQVGLEGSVLSGMSFSLYDGRATWDYAGKVSASATNALLSGTPTNSNSSNATNSTTVAATKPPPVVIRSSPPRVASTNTLANTTNNVVALDTNTIPGLNSLDDVTLAMPQVGSNALHVLTPTLLELQLINTKAPDPAQVAQWNFVNNGNFNAPSTSAIVVTANGQPVSIAAVGFKRRPFYAPFAHYDLRIGNSLYLQLSSPISDNQNIQVTNPDASLWPATMQFNATVNPLRYSPAIHVNQEGYLPNFPKKAMVGYYAGNLGEMSVPPSVGFKLVDAVTGAQVFQGSLNQGPDQGYTYSPTPYQQVYQADFSSFNTPGQYRLVVPGLGGSLPFSINSGVAMSFARAYALGMYHQRCGTNTTLPYTRFVHDVCHGAPANVPMPASSFPFTWNTVSSYSQIINSDNPVQVAPALTGSSAQLFPFIRQGALDVSGGHHDAGDYSKYTINSASFIHYLMFAVDSIPGVSGLDNLGIPESGDGISDVMQEAKWEADFLVKMQDSDGGFYFLVYPQNREYEGDVTPDHGDPQVVWPKTTSVTAASVAVLAQCATSPTFKAAYPATAALYLQKAQLGWQFLTNAIGNYGKNGAYQKITHYGDDFADQDELAWAACQMFLATGDPAIHQLLLSWFNPADPATWRWGWWHMSECYGHAIRSYAFAVQSGRIAAGQLNPTFLSKCLAEIATAGDAALSFSQQNAYGTSFPTPTKAVQSAGWYFSCDQAFDMTVAYQLNPKPDYLTAMLANMNYEGGCNPLNVTFVTGLGWKRQREIVSQWALNDTRVLPPSGIPVGNIQDRSGYLWNYQTELEGLCFPSDATATPSQTTYPYYDRWGDSWNVSTEMVILNEARGIGTLGFLAAQTAASAQSWKAVPAQIVAPANVVPVGSTVTLSLQVPGVDLTGARIVWEARDQEPAFGPTLTFAPVNNGTQWVEAEAQWPDGRRAFASNSFSANSPNVVWADDAVPAGATAGADGGDSWNWVSSNPTPFSGTLAHQSALVAGSSHQQFFFGATATLQVNTGDVLYAYIYLDPMFPPSEVMLQWNDGTWEHRAYWGANILGYGIDGTVSRKYMGPLPATGQWVQLKVPASQVGLEGSTLNGMAFTLYGGRATWDAAGRLSPSSTPPMSTTNSVQISSAALTPGGMVLNWASTAGATYQVGYKNNLSDPNWIPAGASVVAAGATTSWTDTTAAQNGHRFYIVVRLN